jgi:MFS family permease
MPDQTDSTGVTAGVFHRTALKFVVLLGVVSLFADMTYEGARSVTGPYLAVLGASGTAVGIIAGLGELIGYALRLVSGRVADQTGRYWAITMFGYGLNLLAVPLLALTGRWEMAALLMIAERIGKAIRTPARDAMLSHAGGEVGRGWAFGLHEAMDQGGAVVGPLVVAAILYTRGGATSSPSDYRAGFASLLVPALLSLGVLAAAWRLYPRPRDLEVAAPALDTAGFPTAFWLYLAAVSLIAAAYVDFLLFAYHLGKHGVLPATWIPVSYALAMGTAALAALVFGHLFDRLGLSVLIAATVLSVFATPLVFRGGPTAALLGIALWGVGMGAHESIMRAAIAGMVPPDRRGTAYGVFNTGYGVAWFLGSALMGYLYDVSSSTLIIFSIVLQLAAIPLLVIVGRRADSRPGRSRAESGA